jgi:putative oxidoreductase
MKALQVIGRALLGPLFIVGGWDVLRAPEARVQIARDAGTPQPDLAVRANAALMVGAGALLSLGLLPRAAAGALAAALIPTTLAGHPFWKREGAERQRQLTQFLKNLAALGGLLLVAAGSDTAD